MLDALVMIMDGDRERLLGVFLADTKKLQLPLDFGGFGNFEFDRIAPVLGAQFFIEDILADDNAVVADIHPGTLNKLSDFCVRFAAETAKGQLGGARHG